VFFASTVFGRFAASAANAVPEEAVATSVDSCRRRASTVTDVFVPVVARRAEVRMAETSAFFGVAVGSPVLRGWADFWSADTCTVVSVPRHAITAWSWFADALAKVAVENFIVATSVNMTRALALAFMRVKIIINILFGRARFWNAFATAMFLIPCKTCVAFNG